MFIVVGIDESTPVIYSATDDPGWQAWKFQDKPEDKKDAWFWPTPDQPREFLADLIEEGRFDMIYAKAVLEIDLDANQHVRVSKKDPKNWIAEVYKY